MKEGAFYEQVVYLDKVYGSPLHLTTSQYLPSRRRLFTLLARPISVRIRTAVLTISYMERGVDSSFCCSKSPSLAQNLDLLMLRNSGPPRVGKTLTAEAMSEYL